MTLALLAPRSKPTELIEHLTWACDQSPSNNKGERHWSYSKKWKKQPAFTNYSYLQTHYHHIASQKTDGSLEQNSSECKLVSIDKGSIV